MAARLATRPTRRLAAIDAGVKITVARYPDGIDRTASATRRAASRTTRTAPQATSRPRPARAADPPRHSNDPRRRWRGAIRAPSFVVAGTPSSAAADGNPLKVVTPPTDSRPMQVSRTSTIAAPSDGRQRSPAPLGTGSFARPAAWVTAHPIVALATVVLGSFDRAPRSCLRLRDAALLPGRVRLRGARPLDRTRRRVTIRWRARLSFPALVDRSLLTSLAMVAERPRGRLPASRGAFTRSRSLVAAVPVYLLARSPSHPCALREGVVVPAAPGDGRVPRRRPQQAHRAEDHLQERTAGRRATGSSAPRRRFRCSPPNSVSS